MSKAGTRTESRDFPVYTNEEFILESNSNPLYILADRFKCFRLRVRKNHLENEKVFAYLIAGDKKNERVLVYLTFDHHYDLVTNVRIHRRIDFDSQLGLFLSKAMLIRMKKEEHFIFSANTLHFFR